MAIIDYGVVCKKNGKIISSTARLFTPMSDTVGFVNENLDGNYFLIVGDQDCQICFYKNYIEIFNGNERIGEILPLYSYSTARGNKYVLEKDIAGIHFRVKTFDNLYRYKVRFKYKVDVYEAIYGYGVDYNLDNWYDLRKNIKIKVKQWIESKY